MVVLVGLDKWKTYWIGVQVEGMKSISGSKARIKRIAVFISGGDFSIRRLE